ncbi:UvrD-helicase domain-containing protein [Undibacterium arcticum]|uniref:UvrD-helicase domain-containing protein n=1 Tax=Undibacterium arcticum TaxID=1762892 RepID=UPI00361670C5
MQLSEQQLGILGAAGHLLVIGGPGSGKTTVSILKAAQIAKDELRPGQKILFLSFARATISRVMEAIEEERDIAREQKQRIDVDTYHAFFWRILKTHGYLLSLPRNISILTPAAEAIALSAIRSQFAIGRKSTLTDAEKEKKKEQRKDAEAAERMRLAHNEGRICFDLFASFVSAILHGSDRIRQIIATMYPVIILDEFQDTNAGQWHVVEALGQYSRLLALADPEQRIYDWIGADPERLNHFKAAYEPSEYDLQGTNHRSAGTDIALFGNHVLTGQYKDGEYSGVCFETYDPAEKVAMARLVVLTYDARTRLIEAGIKDWSIAILVPTKKMTRIVSDAFHAPPAGLTKVSHVATIEMEAAILGAEVIAFLMQPDVDGRHFELFIGLMLDYYRGKGGDSPTQGDLREAISYRMPIRSGSLDAL